MRSCNIPEGQRKKIKQENSNSDLWENSDPLGAIVYLQGDS